MVCRTLTSSMAPRCNTFCWRESRSRNRSCNRPASCLLVCCASDGACQRKRSWYVTTQHESAREWNTLTHSRSVAALVGDRAAGVGATTSDLVAHQPHATRSIDVVQAQAPLEARAHHAVASHSQQRVRSTGAAVPHSDRAVAHARRAISPAVSRAVGRERVLYDHEQVQALSQVHQGDDLLPARHSSGVPGLGRLARRLDVGRRMDARSRGSVSRFSAANRSRASRSRHNDGGHRAMLIERRPWSYLVTVADQVHKFKLHSFLD